MISAGRLAISLALAGSTLGMNVQNPNIRLPSSAAANKAAVQKIFTDSYAAYKYVRSPCLARATLTINVKQRVRFRSRRPVPC